jgi:hypothetical protein
MSGWIYQPLVPAAADLLSGGVVVTGQIKVWTGAAWEAKPMKVWDGASWVTKPVKFWNGSAWITTPY